MGALIEHLREVPAVYVYVLVALLTFAEAAIFVGFVLPGETAVLIGGVIASTGRVSLTALLVIVPLCAIVGDSVGYEVGRRFGPRLLQLRLLRGHKHRLDGAREFLRERGGLAIFLGRFSAFLRAVIPALAGLSKMPYRTFLAWNATGGILWSVGVVLLGYFAGNSYKKVEGYLGKFSAAVLVLLLLAGLFLWHRHRNRAGDQDSPVPDDQSSSAG